MKYEWLMIHKKQVAVILVIIALLSILQMIQDDRKQRLYLKDGDRVVAVKRSSLDEDTEIPLLIDINIDGEVKTYEVTLSLKGEYQERKKFDLPTAISDPVKAAIDQLTASLETETGVLIELPQNLEDGKRLLWKAPARRNIFLILLLFPLSVYYLYRSEIDLERKKTKRKCEQILKSLPAFNDQLLLLMNSGLIFHDAFLRIAENYKRRESVDSFGSLILNISQTEACFGGSIVSAMKATVGDVALREYSRMVNILADNQYKGVDLREKLEAESELLWAARKAVSLQKGKEIETKLSFPLALLLIVLMIIAGMPAMMNM